MLGADVYVCSPYKFLGRHCGVLAADPVLLERLTPPKLVPSSDQVPERFELGTLAYELLADTTAAVDFLADLSPGPGSTGRRERLVRSLSAVETHEDAVRIELESGLAELPDVRLHARARHRTPTLLLTFDRHDPAELHRRLADHRVNAPAGSFYAIETSRWLGLGAAGGLRVGLAPYTNTDDVHRLLEVLRHELGTP